MRWLHADETPPGPSAPLLPRSNFLRRLGRRRFFPVPRCSWFPHQDYFFWPSLKFPPINKNARELLASRAAFKSWKDVLLRLRILGSQGGPRCPATRGRALGNGNALENRCHHCLYSLNQLPNLSSQSSREDGMPVHYSTHLLHPQASSGAPPAIEGTTRTRSPS